MKWTIEFARKAEVRGWCRPKAYAIVKTDQPMTAVGWKGLASSLAFLNQPFTFYLETGAPVTKEEAAVINTVFEEIVAKLKANEGN